MRLTRLLAVVCAAVALLVVTAGFGYISPGVYPPECGTQHEVVATRHPKGQRPPWAIGDSTMLLAIYNLAAEGYDADAQGCREYADTLELIRERKAAGTLPHMVVMALGADGTVTHNEIGVSLGLLCCSDLLVLVTPRELGGGSGADAETMRQEARRHPGRTVLLDWVKYSAGHPSWFQPDGLHLTTDGATAFARLLAQALPDAYPPKKPRAGKPTPRRGGALSP